MSLNLKTARELGYKKIYVGTIKKFTEYGLDFDVTVQTMLSALDTIAYRPYKMSGYLYKYSLLFQEESAGYYNFNDSFFELLEKNENNVSREERRRYAFVWNSFWKRFGQEVKDESFVVDKLSRLALALPMAIITFRDVTSDNHARFLVNKYVLKSLDIDIRDVDTPFCGSKLVETLMNMLNAIMKWGTTISSLMSVSESIVLESLVMLSYDEFLDSIRNDRFQPLIFRAPERKIETAIIDKEDIYEDID